MGRQVFNPSERATQQLLAQLPLFTQSVLHAADPPVPLAQAEAKPFVVSGQHSLSLPHDWPTADVHAPTGAHHRATAHACVPSGSAAQHPVVQSAPLEQRALQI